MNQDFLLLSGTANPALAAAVAAELGVRPGLCVVGQFSDGETGVRLEESVRGSDGFLVQPASPPVNDRLIERLTLADACRRSAAARITVVVPYFGYARARPEISIAATHGLFVGEARAKLSYKAISDVFVTDSMAVDRPWPTLRIVSIAHLVATAIRRVLAGASLSDLRHDVSKTLEPTR